MRYLAIQEERQEFSVLTSFFVSIGLTIVAIIPAAILLIRIIICTFHGGEFLPHASARIFSISYLTS